MRDEEFSNSDTDGKTAIHDVQAGIHRFCFEVSSDKADFLGKIIIINDSND